MVSYHSDPKGGPFHLLQAPGPLPSRPDPLDQPTQTKLDEVGIVPGPPNPTETEPSKGEITQTPSTTHYAFSPPPPPNNTTPQRQPPSFIRDPD